MSSITAVESDRAVAIAALERRWTREAQELAVRRDYAAADVLRLRSSLPIEHSLARHGAERLRALFHEQPYVHTFGALSGAQAVQMVRAGLDAIYLSGWQVAADANLAGQTYPDQSLYPVNSAPALVRRINNALQRADHVDRVEGRQSRDWFVPIVADAEAGFGGPLHAFELTKAMIDAGAAAVHFEDQLAAEKKCGHLGGKVLVPTAQHIRTLIAARLAADVLDVPTVVVARTDAVSATLLTSDIDPLDHPFISGSRTPEGYFVVEGGIESAIARSLAYAPYADLLWFESSTPDLDQARHFAAAIHERYPGKWLAYNCSPSFNWNAHLDSDAVAAFQCELGALGYKFQFITLAGWHVLNLNSFELANDYAARGMSAYVDLQKREFEAEPVGYSATRHQREVGTGYFDRILETVTNGQGSTAALADSTEQRQFAVKDAAIDENVAAPMTAKTS